MRHRTARPEKENRKERPDSARSPPVFLIVKVKEKKGQALH